MKIKFILFKSYIDKKVSSIRYGLPQPLNKFGL